MCSHPEDHAHILKRCPYLSLPFSIIRRLWGAMVHGNEWVEPSRLCLEHIATSLTTIQGWLCWAAVYVRWLITSERISFQRVNATTVILQRWYSVIWPWHTLSQGALRARYRHDHSAGHSTIFTSQAGLSHSTPTGAATLLPHRVFGARAAHQAEMSTNPSIHVDLPIPFGLLSSCEFVRRPNSGRCRLWP